MQKCFARLSHFALLTGIQNQAFLYLISMWTQVFLVKTDHIRSDQNEAIAPFPFWKQRSFLFCDWILTPVFYFRRQPCFSISNYSDYGIFPHCFCWYYATLQKIMHESLSKRAIDDSLQVMGWFWWKRIINKEAHFIVKPDLLPPLFYPNTLLPKRILTATLGQ